MEHDSRRSRAWIAAQIGLCGMVGSSRRIGVTVQLWTPHTSAVVKEPSDWYRRGFRRQVPLLGRFIADFLAPAQRLIVEVDGGYHGERARADARRDAALARAGYRVLGLDAARVVRDIEAAVWRVRAALRA